MARTVLTKSLFAKSFSVNAASIACYIMNSTLKRPILNKSPYKLCFERKPNIPHFHLFSCRYFIHNNGKDNLHKLILNMTKPCLLVILHLAKLFMSLVKKTLKIEESIHAIFDEFSQNGDRLRKEEDQDD